MIKMKENEQCVMKNVGEFNQNVLKYMIFVQILKLVLPLNPFFSFPLYISHF